MQDLKGLRIKGKFYYFGNKAFNWLLIVFLLVCSQPVAASVLKLDQKTSYYEMGKHIEYLLDEEGKLSFKDIREGSHSFQKGETD